MTGLAGKAEGAVQEERLLRQQAADGSLAAHRPPSVKGMIDLRYDSYRDAGDDANIWRRPDPKKDFVLAVAFAVQRGCSNTLLRANSRRRNRRAAAVVEHENMNGSHIDA